MLRIRAGSVHPVTAPPIEDGAVLVDEHGRIAAVGPHSKVPTPPRAEALEFRDAVLVPGLVNCHTHLELTHLAGRNPEREFPAWIRRIRELKEATSAGEFLRSAMQGVRDAWAAGITCVADTGSSGAAVEALARLGARGVAYLEVFGPDPALVAQSFDLFQTQVAQLRRLATSQLVLGVSPHAPYTVSAELYAKVARHAAHDGLPIAVHLAESGAETALVRDGAGPFADALRVRGIAIRAHGCTPVALLERLGVLRPGTLVIHAVQLEESDLAILAQTRAAVAHCPRSNRAHGHGTAPLAALRAAGVPVGLGTDSVVSVGDLDLWAEARAAGVEGEEALRMLTIEGARALCWDARIGSVDVGKEADLAVFPSTVLHHPPPSSAALLTIVAGRVVHRGQGGPPHNH